MKRLVSMDIEEFYDQDPRQRASEETEFGGKWYENDLRFEVAWVSDTGEVYAMAEPYSRRGVSIQPVRVEILAVIDGRDAVDSVLTGWADGMAGCDVRARQPRMRACTRRRGSWLEDLIRRASAALSMRTDC
jgi:hypothetical protein